MRYLKSTLIALTLATSTTVFAATDTTTTAPTDTSQATAATSPTDASQTSTTTTVSKTTTTTTGQKVKLGKMTCREFIALDESFRPKIIYWAVGHMKGKQAEMFDVEGTDRLIPMIVDECTAKPDQSFWKTLKEKAKQVF